LSGAWDKYTPMHREFALPHSGGGQLTAILFLRTDICMELTQATLAATKVWRREPGPVPRVGGASNHIADCLAVLHSGKSSLILEDKRKTLTPSQIFNLLQSR